MTDRLLYGLVNHIPSGEVYLMRWEDGAVVGPLHYSEHFNVFADKQHFDPVDQQWATGENWQQHNMDGSCIYCTQ